MSEHKALFQVNHGGPEWKTIAEVDIINGIAKTPPAWTAMRALGKRIIYTGHVPEEK